MMYRGKKTNASPEFDTKMQCTPIIWASVCLINGGSLTCLVKVSGFVSFISIRSCTHPRLCLAEL